MKRIWHHFETWEEYHAGMWRDVQKSDRQEILDAAISFTGDHEKYGSAMLRVIAEWPISCEHNLTDVHQNRLAWVGHAACCLAIGSPEWITRSAWGFLSQDQQDKANAKASEAVKRWVKSHEEKATGMGEALGIQRIQGRDSGRGSKEIGGCRKGSVLSNSLHGNSEKRHSLGQPWLLTPEVWGLHGAQEN